MLLGFKETTKLLEKYGIQIYEAKLVQTEADALSFAQQTGYPVVLKAVSENIIHKSDGGFIKLNIKNEQALKESYRELLNLVKQLPIEGILVQKMGFGREVIVGMKSDHQFGPVIMFGLGGIFVEILQDVVLRIAPVAKTEAIKMIKSIKTHKILTGIRGQEPVNVDKLAEIIVSISQMVIENKQIKEVDLNPLIIDGKNILPIDARIIV